MQQPTPDKHDADNLPARIPQADFDLPSQSEVLSAVAKIATFQALVRSELKRGHDYGEIPGTKGDTLLKPGAEKIVRLLGLADTYTITGKIADWDKGLHQYEVRASLVTIGSGHVIAEGVGECNSYESRYRYRWIWERELGEHGYASPDGLRERSARNGGVQYRVQNPDLADVVNTVFKIAKKRALVDAALSVGSLSDLFTQDLDDYPGAQTERRDEPAPARDGRGGRGGGGRNGGGRRQQRAAQPAEDTDRQSRRAELWRTKLSDNEDPEVAEMSAERMGVFLDDVGVTEAQMKQFFVEWKGSKTATVEGWQFNHPDGHQSNVQAARHVIAQLIGGEN